MRILIEYILPLSLPTVLWVLWLTWRQHRAAATGRASPDWRGVPWSWLLAGGLVLAMLMAVGGTMVSGYSTGGYHPATIDPQGHVIPGRIE